MWYTTISTIEARPTEVIYSSHETLQEAINFARRNLAGGRDYNYNVVSEDDARQQGLLPE